MLVKTEIGSSTIYFEDGEEEPLLQKEPELVIYNLERVGCENVKYVGEEISENGDYINVYTFEFEGESYRGEMLPDISITRIGTEVALYAIREDQKAVSFLFHFKLPPTVEAALAATSPKELTEALASEEEWIRKAAQKRMEKLERRCKECQYGNQQ